MKFIKCKLINNFYFVVLYYTLDIYNLYIYIIYILYIYIQVIYNNIYRKAFGKGIWILFNYKYIYILLF